jgi:hypothetical protein
MAASALRENEKECDDGDKQDERGISAVERETAMIMRFIKEVADCCPERPR